MRATTRLDFEGVCRAISSVRAVFVIVSQESVLRLIIEKSLEIDVEIKVSPVAWFVRFENVRHIFESISME